MDSGNTVIVFINKESIIKKFNIIIKKLLVPRLLRLINSILTSLVTNYFTAQMLIGLYIEAILFFITKLLPATLIILGIP